MEFRPVVNEFTRLPRAVPNRGITERMTSTKSDPTNRTETAYLTTVSNRHGDLFHTDRDCPHCPEIATERDRETLEARGLRECKHCAGTTAKNIPDRSHLDSLKRAAEANHGD